MTDGLTRSERARSIGKIELHIPKNRNTEELERERELTGLLERGREN